MALPTASMLRLAALRSPVLEFGKELLDRIEIGRIFGQEEKACAGGSDGLAHGLALVRTEIVRKHDVTLLQGRHEDLFDVGSETLAINRPVEQPWRLDTVMPQGSHEGHGLPMTMRHLSFDALPARCPAPKGRHVRLGPGLVEEHQTRGVNQPAILDPSSSMPRDIGAILLGRDQCLFL